MADTATATFDAHAARYNPARRRLIPPYDRFYGTAVEAVRLAGEPRRILDLGAGTGLLSSRLRDAFPAAELTLLDGAEQMLAQARELLGDRDTHYVVGDLADSLPAEPWDAIVSALAIHHLEDADKRALFARARENLRAGGVFVNAEQVTSASPRFAEVYAAWHEASARVAGSDDAEWAGALERMAHDRCAPVGEQLAWLRAAGFSAADCLFQDHRFAVLVALG